MGAILPNTAKPEQKVQQLTTPLTTQETGRASLFQEQKEHNLPGFFLLPLSLLFLSRHILNGLHHYYR